MEGERVAAGHRKRRFCSHRASLADEGLALGFAPAPGLLPPLPGRGEAEEGEGEGEKGLDSRVDGTTKQNRECMKNHRIKS